MVEFPEVLCQLLVLYNQFVDGAGVSGTRRSRSDRFIPQRVEVLLTPRNRTSGLVLNPFSPIGILAYNMRGGKSIQSLLRTLKPLIGLPISVGAILPRQNGYLFQCKAYEKESRDRGILEKLG